MRRLFLVVLVLLIDGLLAPNAAHQRGTPPLAPAATPTTPLDEETLQGLAILAFPTGETSYTVTVGTLGASIGLQPGQEVVLALGVFDHEGCGIGNRCFVPVSASAAWSVTPASGAHIERASGTLTIDPDTPSGRVFTVSADIEVGRQMVTTEVHTYTMEANPLVGTWSEVSQRACGTGADVAPSHLIEELVFSADGSFAVTWTPFESYVDYWGTYTFDPEHGTLDLDITGGNAIPADVDGRGSVAVEGAGNLILTDLWLGTPQRASGPAHCGHHFAR